MEYGLQHGIWNNRIKSIVLILLFPVLLCAIVFAVSYWFSGSDYEISGQIKNNTAYESAGSILAVLLPILFVRLIIAFYYHKKIVFSFSGAKEISRKDNPEIYNIVENLCISCGLPTPKIGIIETEGMNAFATGLDSSDSRIVFTRGLINKLNRSEIEAVAGHELTHIINKDCMLMLVIVLYIGAISFIGEYMYRYFSFSSYSSSSKKGGISNILPYLGLGLILLGYLFYPLIRFAISREREYLADAGSVMITKNNLAMISALKKISTDSDVELKNNEMAAMFIANPLGKIQALFQTHPSLEDRISALEKY